MLMKAEDKAKWLAALRSGKYNQCDGALTKQGGFCCLGVMEKVLGTGEVEEDYGLPSPQWCANKVCGSTTNMNGKSTQLTR